MDIKLTEEAVRDKEELSEKEWGEIKSVLRKVTDQLSHKDLKLISNPLLKHSIWQLKIDEEETNHRAYLDVENGRTIVIAIWDFEFTHQGDKHCEKLQDRV